MATCMISIYAASGGHGNFYSSSIPIYFELVSNEIFVHYNNLSRVQPVYLYEACGG
jgi:hypothetical protein